MIHRIPPGTRDVLPDEMRELRRMQNSLLEVFDGFNYDEIRTPTIEYADVVERGDDRAAGSAYRFFDDRGELLALRTDMTIPIARLVATRFGEVDPPYRLSYIANAYMAVTPQRAQMREFGHAGIELIGVPGAAGTAEVTQVLSRSLDAVGLSDAVIGLGDADVWSSILKDVGLDDETIERSSYALAGHDLVELSAILESSDRLSSAQVDELIAVTQIRGGAEVLDQARRADIAGPLFLGVLDEIQETFDALSSQGVAGRVQIDLGLLRDLGYYSGSILEVYDPSVGQIIGGGGRYDGLMNRFGVDHAAAGFSLYVERIHMAQLEGGR